MTYPKTSSSAATGPIGKPGQTIRGGYLIARRHAKSGILIRIASRPFEHGSLADAEAQARILAEKHDDEFSVFAQVATVTPPLRVEAISPAEATMIAVDPPQPTARKVIVERRSPRRRMTGGVA